MTLISTYLPWWSFRMCVGEREKLAMYTEMTQAQKLGFKSAGQGHLGDPVG